MDYFADLNIEQAIGLVAAVFFGAAIGLERQLRKHAAGIHTNALVALGAASYVIAALAMGDPTAPGRIVGQVVVGVGFVCAGLIWHHNGTVSGITRSYLPGPWIYLAATLVALASPTASVVLFAAIAVFYVVESSLFGRDEKT